MTFVGYGRAAEGTATTLTFRELDRRVRVLGEIIAGRVAPGEPVAVLCPQGLDYVIGFLGCLAAGAVAVPLYAPEPFRSDAGLVASLKDALPTLVLTTSAARAPVDGLGAAPSLAIDEIGGDTAWRPPERWDETAYLQYTSGSTSSPRGAVISHANLAWSSAQVREAYRIDGSSRVVSWLPLFHDMGLIAGLASPVVAGAHCLLMDPMAFVQHPLRWLHALSSHRATYTAIPNFALDMCVDRTTITQRAGLDLSRLTAVTNGSEPVRDRSLRRFSEAFASAGFRPEAHAPSFGLAEATVLVTAKPFGTEPAIIDCDRAELDAGRVRIVIADDPTARRMVGCGTPTLQDVRIVDPEALTDLGSGRVGEIWVRGPNVAGGYLGQADHPDFGAHLDGTDGWLRTGDAGFLHEGQLYIAGRYKDLIIVDGRNHHPSDLEATIESTLPGLRRGHVIAFSIEVEDTERLVVVAENDPRSQVGTYSDPSALLRAARRALAVGHGIELHDLRVITRGGLPKTTSGKLRRGTCRERYLAGGYQ
ncbi:fatty acyl-AMP ligase [Actinocorallia longicatena]|uniref:Fatty acyl-AMP ligase n=2 Tax=Actinocorallia longicatena TaxID=111803 RepID=A0ABP6QA45_9ACTN